jgi:hypothetical protein
MSDIYKMKLHEVIEIDRCTSAQRVPGGWIYTTCSISRAISSVFVPYNNEFQEGVQK